MKELLEKLENLATTVYDGKITNLEEIADKIIDLQCDLESEYLDLKDRLEKKESIIDDIDSELYVINSHVDAISRILES